MANEKLVGKIQTVLGLIEPSELGVTLTHEHLLIDLTSIHSGMHRDLPQWASRKEFYESPVGLDTIGRIRHYGYPNFDNSRLLSVDTAIEEAILYKEYGGDSLVDATSIGIARDPVGLARISRASGVNVIMGASHYVGDAHPDNMNDISEDAITERIVKDITEGVDGTTIKSGVIGEVGCSWPLTDNERKVLQASARAQRLTGAPILIHPGRDETSPLEIIAILKESGADLSRTIMGHLDRTVFLRDTLTKIAESGCYMEWDLFGREQSFYGANINIDMPSDAKRISDIAWLISEGYGKKIVIAHDICSKDRLECYGGHGYSYILGFVIPRMRERGYNEDDIQNILVNNTRDILTFTDVN